ncbi:MAG: hypothetical protein ACK41T_08185 [Pseudobdellovibrio sp.]
MNSITEKSNFTSTSLIVTTVVICLISAILSSLTPVRKLFNSYTDERKILAKIFTEQNSKSYIIFKIQTHDGIDLEIFEKDTLHGSQKLKQKFSLVEDNDAYLMINHNSVNLTLIDVNGDRTLDIVAPTVDKNGQSRLNTFIYNKDIEQFVPYAEQN